MNIENEILELRAETLAAHALFIGLGQALIQSDPRNLAVLKQAFDYADQLGEIGAFRFGSKEAAPHLAGFAKIVEQLRAATLPNKG